MLYSLNSHSTGRIFSGSTRPFRLLLLATILSVAVAGLNTGAHAAPRDVLLERNCHAILEILREQEQSRFNCVVHPFIAVEAGYGLNNTNFAVALPFNVTGSSFIGGINGGVLIDIPGTNFSVGPRIGWQGGNMSGSTFYPPTGFTYAVNNRSVFYQDVMAQIRVQPFGIITPNRYPGLNFSDVFLRGSVGIAEVHTQVTGTSGAFQVTDSVTQTGFTGTVGIGVPISAAFLGGNLDAYTQYRFINVPSTTVSIPGLVQIDNRWVQGITFGFALRY
jgi:hypothetical protein